MTTDRFDRCLMGHSETATTLHHLRNVNKRTGYLFLECSKVFEFLKQKNKRNVDFTSFLLFLINAADRNRTGTGV